VWEQDTTDSLIYPGPWESTVEFRAINSCNSDSRPSRLFGIGSTIRR